MAKTNSKLTVFRDADAPGAYTWSPFVAKLEAHLRFCHLSYKVSAGSLSESPKGKLPYVRIEDGVGNMQILSDSTLIMRKLVDEEAIADLNASLSPKKKSIRSCDSSPS